MARRQCVAKPRGLAFWLYGLVVSDGQFAADYLYSPCARRQALIVLVMSHVTDCVEIEDVRPYAWRTAFVLGMVFPPGLVFVYAVMGIWVVLSGKRYKQWLVPYRW